MRLINASSILNNIPTGSLCPPYTWTMLWEKACCHATIHFLKEHINPRKTPANSWILFKIIIHKSSNIMNHQWSMSNSITMHLGACFLSCLFFFAAAPMSWNCGTSRTPEFLNFAAPSCKRRLETNRRLLRKTLENERSFQNPWALEKGGNSCLKLWPFLVFTLKMYVRFRGSTPPHSGFQCQIKI